MDWAVREMAAACLGTQDVPAGVTALLADCDGLPFAVEEILAAAVSSGQLVSGPDGWVVDDQVSTGVPESIVGSVRHRLAGLGPLADDLLASAAVLGRQFDWTLLPGMADAAEADVLAELQRAQHVQLIEPVIPSNHMFRFRHSLTRHAILSGLLPPDLVYRSASAAAAVEKAHPELPGSWCELAAELHEAAGERVRAAELLLRVGQARARQGSPQYRGDLAPRREGPARIPGRLSGCGAKRRLAGSALRTASRRVVRSDARHRHRRGPRAGARAGR